MIGKEMTKFNGLLYFIADDGERGRELWRSDGTTNGTVIAEDLLPGPESSNSSYLTATRNGLYYFANDGGDDLSLKRLPALQSVMKHGLANTRPRLPDFAVLSSFGYTLSRSPRVPSSLTQNPIA
jgi:ELWxxDGT repeat protein